MSEAGSDRSAGPEEGTPVDEHLSRRDFLKVAGIAGGGAGLGGALGALLGGCAGSATTTIAGPTTRTGPSATTGTTGVTSTTSTEQAPPPTSVGAGIEEGDVVKAGYVLPLTGSMADRGVAATWHIDWFSKNVWKDGLLMGDGKKHKFTVVTLDTQSDGPRRAAQDLVVEEKVMLIGAGAGAENVVPVREVAENFGCPCVTFDCPGDAWNADQPEGGFKWSWHTWFVLRDMAVNFVTMWDGLKTNKLVGGLYPNDGDGLAFAAALPLVFQAKGYSYVDPGRYEDGAADLSAIIGQMRKEGVEIVNGVPTPADYANFWKQAVQQGFRPKISTQAKAMLFPAGVNALGDWATADL